jgi:cobalamin biosynthesis protein CobT
VDAIALASQHHGSGHRHRPETAAAGHLAALVHEIRLEHGERLPASLDRVLAIYQELAEQPGANVPRLTECVHDAVENSRELAEQAAAATTAFHSAPKKRKPASGQWLGLKTEFSP